MLSLAFASPKLGVPLRVGTIPGAGIRLGTPWVSADVGGGYWREGFEQAGLVAYEASRARAWTVLRIGPGGLGEGWFVLVAADGSVQTTVFDEVGYGGTLGPSQAAWLDLRAGVGGEVEAAPGVSIGGEIYLPAWQRRSWTDDQIEQLALELSAALTVTWWPGAWREARSMPTSP